MMDKITLVQENFSVGDLRGNADKLIEVCRLAQAGSSGLVVFPELCITGYPPEDLLLKPSFVRDNLAQLQRVVSSVGDIVTVFGFVDSLEDNIFNAAAVAHKGRLLGVYHKQMLPNYGVFDEKRYFSPGSGTKIFKIEDFSFGVNICEDIWHESGPAREQAAAGAELLVNISASPYHTGKVLERRKMLSCRAASYGVPIAYVNLLGGQDELVFDGQSVFADANGLIKCSGALFSAQLVACSLFSGGTSVDLTCEEEEVYRALIMGLKDYCRKNGFKKVVLGLSGGIDSALTAVLAADALGKENVTAVFMPSRYTLGRSGEDSAELVSRLGINYMTVSIEPLLKVYMLTLEEVFRGVTRDVTEENLQARIRGNLLMALSNKFGWLVLATGNKSEMSVGYSTIYGDLAGGLALLKDVPKTLVYRLAAHRNKSGQVIPGNIILREPTAELRAGQKDSDNLPPYDELDAILEAHIEQEQSAEDIISRGFSEATVRRVIALVDKNEFKRRQSPPGIKITPRAFGKDRRMPITNMYTEAG